MFEKGYEHLIGYWYSAFEQTPSLHFRSAIHLRVTCGVLSGYFGPDELWWVRYTQRSMVKIRVCRRNGDEKRDMSGLEKHPLLSMCASTYLARVLT